MLPSWLKDSAGLSTTDSSFLILRVIMVWHLKIGLMENLQFSLNELINYTEALFYISLL